MRWSRLVAVLLLFAAGGMPGWQLTPVVAQSDEPLLVATDPPRGAPAKFSRRGTLAGTPVRLRVRGPVLEYILADNDWKLESPAGAVAAKVVLPPEPVPLATSELTGFTTSTDGADLVVFFDRGIDQFAINRLEIRLASSEVLSVASVASSPDNVTFTTTAAKQLLYQRIAGGQLSRVAALELTETSDRYLKLRLSGQAGIPVASARCWYETDYDHPVYRINAALGPMQDSAVPGESVWPLLLQNDSQPLLKIKVLSSMGGEVRPVRLVQTAASDDSAAREYAIDWADGIRHGGLELSHKWISLTELGYGNDWSLVVDDGDGPILQLSGLEAYAAEVFIDFLLPEGVTGADSDDGSSQLVLWQAAASGDADTETVRDFTNPVLIGELTGWSMSRPLTEPVRSATPVFAVLYDELWWRKPAAYGAGALVLLILGLILLRRSPRRV